MKSNIVINTKYKNKYLFNRKQNFFSICHPIISLLLELDEKGINLSQWINELSDFIEIEKYGRFYKKEVKYYYSKYLFLKSHGQLDSFHFYKKKVPNYSVSKIKSLIANCESLTLEVTERCNLNCKYCAYGEHFCWFDNRNNKDLSYDKAIRLIDYLLGYIGSFRKKKFINNFDIGFYGGEPLLNFKLINNVIKYLKLNTKKGVHITYSMTTNGLLLKKYMDFLVENDFFLTISLDGNKEHNCYRTLHNGRPSFDIIVENIFALKVAYPEYFEKRVTFNSVFHNKSNTNEINSFFRKTFGKLPNLSELDIGGVKPEKQEEFQKMLKKTESDLTKLPNIGNALLKEEYQINPFYTNLNEFIINNHKNVIVNYKQFITGQKTAQPLTGTCEPFTKRTFLSTNGKIHVCENIDHKFSVGMVTDNKVELDFEKIAESYKKYYQSINHLCSNCYFSNDCAECFFFIENIGQSRVRCKSFLRNEKEYSAYLARQIELLEEAPRLYSTIINE